MSLLKAVFKTDMSRGSQSGHPMPTSLGGKENTLALPPTEVRVFSSSIRLYRFTLNLMYQILFKNNIIASRYTCVGC